MPYIEKGLRGALDRHVDALTDTLLLYNLNPGDVTYVVYRLVGNLFFSRKKYATWALLRGAVSDALAEFRCRHVAEYEADKLLDNGDVQFHARPKHEPTSR